MAHKSEEDITGLLIEWGNGERAAPDRQVPLLQAELRRTARRQMRRERDGHTLQTTALVNEAYLRLVDYGACVHATAPTSSPSPRRRMRRIVVDRARPSAPVTEVPAPDSCPWTARKARAPSGPGTCWRLTPRSQP